MTTAELLEVRTPYGLIGDAYSVYQGPCRPRITLRQAFVAGVLSFSVNRSHIGCPLGAPTVRGYYDDFAAAASEWVTAGPEWRVSAHARGWGFTEECILPL